MKSHEKFLEAFENHADALFRHATFRLSDRERVEDIVQDAFVKTWEYLSKGNTIDDFRPFLYKTLNNLIIDEYRKKKHGSLDELIDEEWKEGRVENLVSDDFDTITAQIDGAKMLEEVARMPETYRTVVLMRFVDGLEPREIAEATGKDTNLVSVHMHRGLAWLRKEIEMKEAKQKKNYE